MKQLNLIYKSSSHKRKEHGGSLSIGKRRSSRPLTVKSPLHIVLRSDFATASRSLLRHRPLIHNVIKKAKNRFRIRIYEMAIVSNHIHLLIKGRNRRDIQNFFRMIAGHIAQEILRKFPIQRAERGGAPKVELGERGERENKFWETRIYSRLVSWGRDYINVKKYVIQNALEALGLIPYKARGKIPSTTRSMSLKVERKVILQI